MNIAIAARDCRSALDQTVTRPAPAVRCQSNRCETAPVANRCETERALGLGCWHLASHHTEVLSGRLELPHRRRRKSWVGNAAQKTARCICEFWTASVHRAGNGQRVCRCWTGWAPRAAATATVGPPDSRGKGADSERKQGASSRSRPTAGSAGASSRSASSQPVAARISTGCASAGGWE